MNKNKQLASQKGKLKNLTQQAPINRKKPVIVAVMEACA